MESATTSKPPLKKLKTEVSPGHHRVVPDHARQPVFNLSSLRSPLPPNTSQDGSNDSSSGGTSTKRMKNDSEYYTNPKQRLETFKKSGENIALQCKRLQEKTMCAVYYGAQYTSISGKRIHYSFGEYFPDPDAEVETPLNTKTGAIPSPALPTLIPQKLPAEPVRLPFVIPPSPPLQPKPDPVGSTEPCSHCRKQVVIGPDLKIIETQWAQCHGGDDQPCSSRIHADCLGFPGSKKLPDYYCPKHIIYGRRNEKVNSYYP